MRLMADENVPSSVVRQLRELGHDVLSVRESLRGEADRVILERAVDEHRILVTQDKDFGELVFLLGTSGEYGVVLFRLTGSDVKADNDRIVEVIDRARRLVGTVCGRYRSPNPPAVTSRRRKASLGMYRTNALDRRPPRR
jgi:predicted nuclease of predicted toxin-antitoxin system